MQIPQPLQQPKVGRAQCSQTGERLNIPGDVFSHKEEWSSDTRYEVDEPGELAHKEARLERANVACFIYMKHLDKANSQRQKVDQKFPRAGGSRWVEGLQKLRAPVWSNKILEIMAMVAHGECNQCH
jgi:hypothetical protein